MEPINELTQTVRKYPTITSAGIIEIGQIVLKNQFWFLDNQTMIILTFFTRDYNLNNICRDICVEETFKCIMTCDPTDPECVYGCLRAEVTCFDSKYFNKRINDKN